MKTNINGQVYKFSEDGSWEHLPNESSLLLKADGPKKKDGTLKAKYKDLPRYKLIPIYEDHFKKEFDKTLKELNKDVFKFLKDSIL